MLTNELGDKTLDQIARNAVGFGTYVLISFHNGVAEPVFIDRGMTQRLWNVATHLLRTKHAEVSLANGEGRVKDGKEVRRGRQAPARQEGVQGQEEVT